MNTFHAFRAVTILFVLAGAICGCASQDKCGTDGCPSDAQITANVQAKLNQMTDFGPPDTIMVQTQHHVVYLNGLVYAGVAKHLAESVAMQSPGVSQVVNGIAILR